MAIQQITEKEYKKLLRMRKRRQNLGILLKAGMNGKFYKNNRADMKGVQEMVELEQKIKKGVKSGLCDNEQLTLF